MHLRSIGTDGVMHDVTESWISHFRRTIKNYQSILDALKKGRTTVRGGLRSASYYGSAAVTAKSQSQPISPIWVESDPQNRGLINPAKQTARRRPGTPNKSAGYRA